MRVLILSLVFGLMFGAAHVSGNECMDFNEFQSSDDGKIVGTVDAALYYMGDVPRVLVAHSFVGTRKGWIYVKHTVKDRNQQIIFTEVDVIRMVSKSKHKKYNYLYDKHGKCFSAKEEHKRIALLTVLGIERYIAGY